MKPASALDERKVRQLGEQGFIARATEHGAEQGRGLVAHDRDGLDCFAQRGREILDTAASERVQRCGFGDDTAELGRCPVPRGELERERIAEGESGDERVVPIGSPLAEVVNLESTAAASPLTAAE